MKRTGMVLGTAVAIAWALPTVALAEVVAAARSPKGEFPEFRVLLDAVGQPRAVANFMGLADGSQAWVDAATGEVRGGSEDAFYKGMAFDTVGEGYVSGGLMGGTQAEGEVPYAGGPGYTIAGKTNEVRTAFGWGALALVEGYGPHSGGSEIALLLTNSMVAWTVFGKVKAGDEAGLEELAARVAASGPTEVEWTVDASGATEMELSALETAKTALPVPQRVEALQTAGRIQWPVPGKSHQKTSATTDLMESWAEREWWDEGDARMAGWEWFGLDGGTGFTKGSFTGVRYPMLAKSELAGKWRVTFEHTGQRIRYWFDFGAGTGHWEQEQDGETTDSGALASLSVQRLTGNSFGVAFTLGSGFGTIWTFYYLGFAGESEREGRFWSEQINTVGYYTSDWGMFGMEEGWGEEGTETRDHESGARSQKSTVGEKKAGSGRGVWVGQRGHRAGSRTGKAAFGVPAWEREREQVPGKTGKDGVSDGGEESESGVFREGDAGAEEGEAGFDGREGFDGIGVAAEGVGECGFDGDGLVESGVEGEGDGKGVAQDGVPGSRFQGVAGDGEDFSGGGRGVGGGGEEPGDVVEQGRIAGSGGGEREEPREGL